jgi:dihydroorotate dehydrogenase (NAD+) catalytic subunit
MADLHVRVGAIELTSPVIAAAGPLTDSGEGMLSCLAGGAAAVVARTASVQPAPPMAGPRLSDACTMRGALLTTEMWSERTVKQRVAEDYPRLKASVAPLIISLGHSAEHIRQLAPLIAPFAAAVELSTQFLADNPTLMTAAVRAAKEALAVPIWVKLTVPGRDVVEWAKAAQDAGADAVVAVGPFGPCLGVDAEQARVTFPATGGYAWMTGAAIKNIALRCVWDIVRQTGIPIIGCGGVARGTDVAEFLMAGASAVQVCTAAILQGPPVFGKISSELSDWLDSHRQPSAALLTGYTLRRVQGRQVRSHHVPPVLDVGLCTGCEICPTSCVYGAIEMIGHRRTPDYKARLIAERCWGCGICATRCPTRALRMAGVSV